MSPSEATAAASRLRADLGPEVCLLGDDIPGRARGDLSGMQRSDPIAWTAPRTLVQVGEVVRRCASLGLPMVVQGGMTGLAGGATPTPAEVAISLERLTGIEDFDPEEGSVVVMAGTPLAQLQDWLRDRGRETLYDLGARGQCTVGGNIATNAGGNRVVQAGMAGDGLLGLEAVLPNGTTVSDLNRLLKANRGPAWPRLFIGSEGTLGILTRLVLRTAPLTRYACAMVGVKDLDTAKAFLTQLRQRFPHCLRAIEAMWSEFRQVACEKGRIEDPLGGYNGIALIVELVVSDDQAEMAQHAWYVDRIEAGLIDDVVVARSIADERRLWALRETPYLYRRWFAETIGFDIALPLARLGPALDACRGLYALAVPEARCLFYGHLGDGNVHVVLVSDRRIDDRSGLAERTALIARSFGGSISAEHGIGRQKVALLRATEPAANLELLRSLKHAVDPQGLMNGGRVFAPAEST